MYLAPVFVLLASFSLVISATLRIQISPSNILHNPNALPASTHATLTSGTSTQLRAPLRRGSVIEFSNLNESGSYLLNIFSQDYTFAPYRVDISKSEGGGDAIIEGVWETYQGTRWEDRGIILGGRNANQYSAVIQPQTVLVPAKILSKKIFYEKREGFNPVNLLKNPMLLLGIVALAFAFGMPKMMENMDPEMKAEYEEMQKKGPVTGLTRAMQGQGPASSGGFDLASWMAGAPQTQTGTRTTGTDVRDGGIRERRRG